MTQSFLDTLHLFSCGSLGVTPEIDHTISLKEIYWHSTAQGIIPMVFLGLQNLPETVKKGLDCEAYKSFKYNTLVNIAVNAKKIDYIHKLLIRFRQDKIDYCILKGESLAYLYHKPDFRISSDTDIYIDLKKKNKAKKILSDFGFKIKPFNKTSHHIAAWHPIGGLIELHLHLYNELFGDLWFDKKIYNQEPYKTIRSKDGYEITTLGITDGLIFIALHFIKHFLLEGVGVKQLMDLLLYMKKYKKEIDWNRFEKLLNHLKYKKFIEISIGIGIEFLHFKKEDLPYFTSDDALMNEILTDIEKGGIFGKNESNRSGFYLEYTRERFNTFKKGDYNSYIKKWQYLNLIRALFPRYDYLKLKFPYIDKKPLLYPIAWIHRLAKVPVLLVKAEKSIGTVFDPGKAVRENETIKKRMELIRRLDMI